MLSTTQIAKQILFMVMVLSQQVVQKYNFIVSNRVDQGDLWYIHMKTLTRITSNKLQMVSDFFTITMFIIVV